MSIQSRQYVNNTIGSVSIMLICNIYEMYMCYRVDATYTRSFNSVGPRIDQMTRRVTTPPTPTPSTCVGVSPPPPILPTQREQDSST